MVIAGAASSLWDEQNRNAQGIAGVALGLGLGERGVLIGITVALTESTLTNVDYGDMMGPGGTMSSSRGLFQQLSAWGTLADRMNPVTAATMFYTGGAAGQAGLTDIIGFPGHVAIYLGTIDGTRYLLEASTVGVPVHVKALTRNDYDDVLYRYWS